MSNWLHEEAEAELGDAAVFYRESANRRVAEAFLEEFVRVVLLLEGNQRLGTRKEAGMRTYPFRRFPYSLVYRESDEDGPRIYAVAHQSRNPGYWRTRT